MKDAALRYGTPEPFLVAGLHRLSGEMFSKQKNERHDYVSRVVNYVDASYMQPISVEGIAEMLSLDRRYLSRIFKEKYGITIRDYISQVRIQRACALLDAGMSVSETAQMVGAPDAANFSKLFRTHRGVSPKQYQTRMQKN